MFKKYLATIDNRTSDICRRMNGTIVPINEPFVDTVTGLRSDIPNLHPNCRSSFVLIREDEIK